MFLVRRTQDLTIHTGSDGDNTSDHNVASPWDQGVCYIGVLQEPYCMQ